MAYENHIYDEVEMERAEARKLQPHFIASFFLEAFKRLGGTVREREPKRYEITRVPAIIRNRDRAIGMRDPVLTNYERITFEKSLISVVGKPVAEFLCPGHPLLDTTLDIILERHRDLLKQGTILISENDPWIGIVCGSEVTGSGKVTSPVNDPLLCTVAVSEPPRASRSN